MISEFGAQLKTQILQNICIPSGILDDGVSYLGYLCMLGYSLGIFL
jgi:hypothetical protein